MDFRSQTTPFTPCETAAAVCVEKSAVCRPRREKKPQLTLPSWTHGRAVRRADPRRSADRKVDRKCMQASTSAQCFCSGGVKGGPVPSTQRIPRRDSAVVSCFIAVCVFNLGGTFKDFQAFFSEFSSVLKHT